MAIVPLQAIGAAPPGIGLLPVAAPQAVVKASGPSFADLVANGLDAVDSKVAKADALMKAFTLGEAIPVHQVTIALEEARIAVELSVQIRERLTETYRSFMNMQL